VRRCRFTRTFVNAGAHRQSTIPPWKIAKMRLAPKLVTEGWTCQQLAYSQRSATIESIERARRAGTRQASAATAMSSIDTAKTMIGSCAPFSIQRPMMRLSPKLSARPAAIPRPTPVPEDRHNAHHVAAPRSEGDANPQLTGALQDRIGDYAVQTYRGETQRQYGERAKEHGDETRPRILRLALDPAFEVPHVVEVVSGQIPRREITYTKV
jgi:hypothetical protein